MREKRVKGVTLRVVRKVEENRSPKILDILIVLMFKFHVMTHFTHDLDRLVWSLYVQCLQRDLNVILGQENK